MLALQTGRNRHDHADRNREWFKPDKDFGIIAADDGTNDLFARFSQIQGSDFKTLTRNHGVEFEATQSRKRPRACDHRPV